MVYSVLSALAIACILIFDGVIIKNIFVLRGTERTKYVRSFKQGECAVIYFIAAPLFYMGLLFEKENWFFGIFKALENSAKMVILDFGYEEVSTLSESNIIFKIAILVCFLSAAFNSALLFISLLSQYLDYAFDLFRWKFTRKNRVIFAGNNESNRFAVKTAKKAALAMIFDDISKDAASELFTERVPYINTPNLSDYICERLSEALYGKGRLTIVINTEDDSENIVLAGKVLSVLESFVKTTIGRDTDQHTDKEKSFIVDNFRRISIFVVKNPSFSSIYDELERDSFGCIHSFSKYEQIALDFMQKYPFSLYMGEEIIDKENALVKEDAIIQYQLFGLGKVNEEILFSGISENQFLMKKNGKIVPKDMEYHIFDRSNVGNIRRLTETFYRYSVDFMKDANPLDYLELPKVPAKLSFHEADFSSGDFIRELSAVTRPKKCYTYAIVSFDSDIENIALAEILYNLRARNGWENYHIFVRVSQDADSYEIFSKDGVYAIGNENEVVFNFNNIVNDKLSKMALLRNRDYYVTKGEKAAMLADYTWFVKRFPIERMSNVYCVMALRLKLNMMGLDLLLNDSEDEREIISENEYKAIYEPLKDTMAIQEHYRWNAFYFARGYVPASRDEILKSSENGKDHIALKHGNLTTMDGLREFGKMIAKRDNVSEEEADVIKYDYDIMDSAYRYITEAGYVMVKKKINSCIR